MRRVDRGERREERGERRGNEVNINIVRRLATWA